MDQQTLTGPLLYLLIVWGVVTAVFLVLLLRRSLLASHEDDQIFLDAAEEHMAKEQRELVAKINALSRPILGTGILAAHAKPGQHVVFYEIDPLVKRLSVPPKGEKPYFYFIQDAQERVEAVRLSQNRTRSNLQRAWFLHVMVVRNEVRGRHSLLSKNGGG